MAFTKQSIVHWNDLNQKLADKDSRVAFYEERDALLEQLLEEGKTDSYWGEVFPQDQQYGFRNVLVKRLWADAETAQQFDDLLVFLVNKYDVTDALVSHEIIDYPAAS